MRYPIVIHKDSDSDFGVTVPDVEGCFSAGESLEEAIDMAREAIECHLEGMLMDGEAIPVPTSMEAHQQNQDYANGIWALVDIDLSKLSVSLSAAERSVMTLSGRDFDKFLHDCNQAKAPNQSLQNAARFARKSGIN